MEWFKAIPLWLDLDSIRVVHACWHQLYTAVEILLKGPEISLPPYGTSKFKDTDGTARAKARIRWWDRDATTLREIAEIPPHAKNEDDQPCPSLGDIEVDEKALSYIYTNEVPVFFGHSWHRDKPQPKRDWTDYCACVGLQCGEGWHVDRLPMVGRKGDRAPTLRADRLIRRCRIG